MEDLRAKIEQSLQSFERSATTLSAYVVSIDGALNPARENKEGALAGLAKIRSEITDFKAKFGESLFSQGDADYALRAMMVFADQQSSSPNLFNRMGFVYLVAVFDAFLTETFEAVARARPEVMKSKKQIALAELLAFDSMASLIEHLAKREINEISYKDIASQIEYFEQRFGVDLLDSGVSLADLVEVRATRNLLIHANGVVNDLYLKQVPNSPHNNGDSIFVGIPFFQETEENLRKVAKYAASALLSKHANSELTALGPSSPGG